MKRAFCFLVCVALFLSFTHRSYAECGDKGYNWFIIKHKGELPTFSKEAELVDEVGGIYLDSSETAKGEKRVYLTFDAGYENGNIEKILDIMKEEEVKGAFFILSNLVFKNTELLKRMANEGHLICNHTSKHKDQTTLSDDGIKENLLKLEEVYTEKTGMKLAKYFRFPEGRYSERALKVIKELGYTSVFWSVSYADWDDSKIESSEYALNKLLPQIHPGAVVLLHPTSKTNAEMLSEFIRTLKSEGYSFATLDMYGK